MTTAARLNEPGSRCPKDRGSYGRNGCCKESPSRAGRMRTPSSPGMKPLIFHPASQREYNDALMEYETEAGPGVAVWAGAKVVRHTDAVFHLPAPAGTSAGESERLSPHFPSSPVSPSHPIKALGAMTPQRLSRRRFAGLCTLALPALLKAADPPPADASPFAGFDREVESFMSERNVPGAALAVVKDKRLVYAKGYGWADRDRKLPARADSLFRIASISKPITAVAVMKLIEDGKLSLDTKAFDLLKLEPFFEKGAKPDERLRTITVRQLLQHTAGWDRDASFDPMFRPGRIAEVTRTPPPAGPEAVIRYMLGRQLDFDPGARYAYSNLGYCVLGRIIEKLTGSRYEDFVRKTVLTPCGIRHMTLGRSLEGQAAANEVRYYAEGDEQDDSVFPDKPGKVPAPYGAFHLEAMDAHGAWIGSAVDLARFAAALYGPASSPLLKAETIREMFAVPPPPVVPKEKRYYGCGWSVRLAGPKGELSTSHNGSLPGTATFLVRRWDGISWAMLFNQRSADKSKPDSAIEAALHRAADAMTAWPEPDLFAQFD